MSEHDIPSVPHEAASTSHQTGDVAQQLAALQARVRELTTDNADLLNEVMRLAKVEDAYSDIQTTAKLATVESNMFQAGYKKLEQESRYDPMTGALKERALKNKLAERLAENPNAKLGLVFIDLGNFKKANKRSQTEGDDVLTIFASTFHRANDIIGRSADAGDEFVAVIDLDTEPTLDTTDMQEDDRLQATLDIQIERIRGTRKLLVEKYPHMDEGAVRIFVGAGGIVYDPSLSYEANRIAAEEEMQQNKREDHKIYGKYRVEE